MSKQDLVKTGSMMAQEILTALHLPGSIALSRATEAALKRRHDAGVAALLDELEQGGREGVTFGTEDHDDFVQMLLRYGDAMQKGTAQRNLRLLGRLIVGLKADGSFHFDEFSRLAGALEGLSLAELELLARMYQVRLKHPEGDGESEADNAFARALKDGPIDERSMSAQIGALTRTGFVVAFSGFGALVYVPAPSLFRLAQLAGWPTNVPPFSDG